MNKVIIFLLSILILLPVASAITIDNPQQTFVFDNITVNFSSNQTFDSLELGEDYISLSGSIFQIIPSSDSLNVTITIWNTTGDYYKKWNESSSNFSVTTRHIIGDFPATTIIQIKKNGANWNNYTSNATGYISFTYTDGYSDIQFEAQVADTIHSSCTPVIRAILGMLTTLLVVILLLYIAKSIYDTNNIIQSLIYMALAIIIGLSMAAFVISGVVSSTCP